MRREAVKEAPGRWPWLLRLKLNSSPAVAPLCIDLKSFGVKASSVRSLVLHTLLHAFSLCRHRLYLHHLGKLVAPACGILVLSALADYRHLVMFRIEIGACVNHTACECEAT